MRILVKNLTFILRFCWCQGLLEVIFMYFHLILVAVQQIIKWNNRSLVNILLTNTCVCRVILSSKVATHSMWLLKLHKIPKTNFLVTVVPFQIPNSQMVATVE